MVHDLSLQHCTNIIWAYASISWSTPTLMPTLVAGERGVKRQADVAGWRQACLRLSSGLARRLIVWRQAERIGCTEGFCAARIQSLLSPSLFSLSPLSSALPLPILPPRRRPAVAEIKSRLQETQFNLQQLSNLLWSLAIAQQCDRQVWDRCIEQVGVRCREGAGCRPPQSRAACLAWLPACFPPRPCLHPRLPHLLLPCPACSWARWRRLTERCLQRR